MDHNANGPEIWSHSPNDHDESLRLSADGVFRVVKGGDEEILPSPARVVEYVLQAILEKRLWPRFAAFMPTLYPVDGSQALHVRAEFTGGAAGIIIAAAEVSQLSPADYIRQAVRDHAGSLLADAVPGDAEEIASLFCVASKVGKGEA
jgi:hypothetical protein